MFKKKISGWSGSNRHPKTSNRLHSSKKANGWKNHPQLAGDDVYLFQRAGRVRYNWFQLLNGFNEQPYVVRP